MPEYGGGSFPFGEIISAGVAVLLLCGAEVF